MNLIFSSTLPRVEEKAPRVEEPKFGGWSTRFGESRHSGVWRSKEYIEAGPDFFTRVCTTKFSGYGFLGGT